MDVEYAKSFINATREVLSATAELNVVAGPPYVKNTVTASGSVSALIGMTGDRSGTFSISFESSTAVHIVRKMLGDQVENILEDIQDAMGEITNMISGHARVGLVGKGLKLQGSTPSVIMGKDHSIMHKSAAKPIAIPFSCEAGRFTLEFCFD
jgi:chemotaxis protein CheX